MFRGLVNSMRGYVGPLFGDYLCVDSYTTGSLKLINLTICYFSHAFRVTQRNLFRFASYRLWHPFNAPSFTFSTVAKCNGGLRLAKHNTCSYLKTNFQRTKLFTKRPLRSDTNLLSRYVAYVLS